MSSSLSSSSRIVLFLIGIVCIGVSYGTINYSECFPNGCSLLQSETNGWSTPVSNTEKEIMTPLGCQKVTAGTTTHRYFIPTRTAREWDLFQTYHPTGITIRACTVNGVCGGSSNSCSIGSPTGYSPGVCGGSATWTCLGSNGGVNASCSIPNPVCPIIQLIVGDFMFDAYSMTGNSATYALPPSFQTNGTYTISYGIRGNFDNVGCSRASVRITVRNSSNTIIGDGRWQRPSNCTTFDTKSFPTSGSPSSIYLETRFEGIDVNGQWNGHVWVRNFSIIQN